MRSLALARGALRQLRPLRPLPARPLSLRAAAAGFRSSYAATARYASSTPHNVDDLAEPTKNHPYEYTEDFDDEDVDDYFIDKPESVAIVGGGITGLTTAYYLALRDPHMKITLLEGSARLGGWMNTNVVKDPDTGLPVFIENGPKTLRSLTSTPTRADDFVLADLLINLGVHPCVTVPGAKFVLDSQPSRVEPGATESHLLRVPPPLLIKQLLHPAWRGWAKSVVSLWLLSMRVKFGITAFPTPDDDMTVGQWLRSLNLGKENNAPMLESMLTAMAHGIYGGDIEKLGVQSFLNTRFFQLYRRNQPSDTRMVPVEDMQLMLDLGRDPLVVDYIKYMGLGESLMFPGGMQTLIGALEEVLHAQPNITIRKNEKVDALRLTPDGEKVLVASTSSVTGEKSEGRFDKVVSTIFSRHLAAITPSHSENDHDHDHESTTALPTLAAQEAVSVLNVGFFFDTKIRLPDDLTGVLPLPSVDSPVLGVFVDSNLTGPTVAQHIRAHEAPGTKISVLVGGAHWAGLSRAEIDARKDAGEDAARHFLRHFLGIAETPVLTQSFLAHECIPQHAPGHRAAMQRAHAELLDAFGGRLAVAGGSYTAIGILPSIRAGYCVARHIAPTNDLPANDYTGLTGLRGFTKDTMFTDMHDEQLAELGKKTRYAEADPHAMDKFRHLVAQIRVPPEHK